VSYLGFGLPMLLSSVGSVNAAAVILETMTVLALLTAAGRAVRLRRDSHRQS
jgi:hypothetical protein